MVFYANQMIKKEEKKEILIIVISFLF